MNQNLLFLPYPRAIEYTGGLLELSNHKSIVLADPRLEQIPFSARRFQTALKNAAGFEWEIVARSPETQERTGLTLELDADRGKDEQAYTLDIRPEGIHINAPGEAGIFYGICTLNQILDQCGVRLPCLRVEDAPDFQERGVMLDISRDKVPKIETLYELIDRLASWKINQLQLYTEHTFAFQNHPVVWQDASPLTAQEVRELDAYCRQRFIELVPNQNSFGHMTRWLKHPQYSALAETLEEFDTPWGRQQGPFSLAPVNPGSLRLIQSLYDELLPNFTSRMVNVGCDETFDIGSGQSREECARRGVDRVMFAYLMELYDEIKRRGLTMQFWADILVHHPHLIDEMPKDAIALLWNYDAVHSFQEPTALFQKTGMPFYVCPGTSSWNSLAGRTQNTLANCLDAAVYGHARGALGYLNTDWGDNGHWQALPVSLPGLVAGAAYSWCVETNRYALVDAMLSRFAFEDRNGVAGRVMTRLGNVYLETRLDLPNSSPLFWVLQYPLATLRNLAHINADRFTACLEEIDGAVSDLGKAEIQRPDSELIQREIRLSARMMRHACLRGRLLVEGESAPDGVLIRNLKADVEEWLEEYRQIWLERNRPGGLKDSVTGIERLVKEYNQLQK